METLEPSASRHTSSNFSRSQQILSAVYHSGLAGLGKLSDLRSISADLDKMLTEMQRQDTHLRAANITSTESREPSVPCGNEPRSTNWRSASCRSPFPNTKTVCVLLEDGADHSLRLDLPRFHMPTWTAWSEILATFMTQCACGWVGQSQSFGRAMGAVGPISSDFAPKRCFESCGIL